MQGQADSLLKKKKILLLTTGGTLASIPEVVRDGKTYLTSEEVLEQIQPIIQPYEVKAEGVFRQDSSNIQPHQWQALAERILERCDSFDGIVLTHGTDTLAYTSSMLSFMLQEIPIPVVVTGAQIPLLDPLSDGLANLRCAFAMASSGVGGIFVAFREKIMLGAHVVKSRSVSLDAFESVGAHCVGKVTAKGLLLYKERIPKQGGGKRCKTNLCEKVFLLKMAPSVGPELLQYLAKSGYRGVVVEAYGKGTLPTQDTAWRNALETLSGQNIPVVVCGQCQLEAFVEPPTWCNESNHHLIFAGDMTTEAAVTKLMWGLGQVERAGEPKEETVKNLQTIFRGNLVGEKREAAQEEKKSCNLRFTFAEGNATIKQ